MPVVVMVPTSSFVECQFALEPVFDFISPLPTNVYGKGIASAAHSNFSTLCPLRTRSTNTGIGAERENGSIAEPRAKRAV